jgi:predicted DNA-binding transcriptional regulator YafY
MNSLIDALRVKQLRRSWLLIALLRGTHGCTLRRLAREAGVCERTIRRDLNALEAAGLPVQRLTDTDSEHGKPWRLLKGAPCPVCNRGVATGKEYREERISA